MRTVGVDLAAEPANTAIAVIEWEPSAQVVAVEIPGDDEAVLRHARDADKIGIDCPLGWPDKFVDFLCAHRDQREHSVIEPTSAKWRRTLSYRRTDEHVRNTVGLIPLSVSTDRIGITAMRAAQLQDALARAGHPVDRAGSGLIVEVYPAAGLKYWALTHQRYKGTTGRASLGTLVTDLGRWIHLGQYEEDCRRSDHVFDAVVSAVLARAAALGRTTLPPAELRDKAGREGWIALPTCALSDLVAT